MVKSLVKILQISRTKLVPIIFTLCVIGSYALASRDFDIKIMIFLGILGYIMRELEYPLAP